MNRVNNIVGQLNGVATSSMEQQHTSAPYGVIGTKGDNDVCIVSAVRTPITRAKKGGFKDTTPDTLLKAVLEGVINKSGMKHEVLGDICVGNVQLEGSFAGPARMAMFTAGYPDSVPIHCINRQCSSGLQAVAHIANAIAAGQIDAGVGAGVESMTMGGGVSKGSNMGPPPIDLETVMKTPLAALCMTPMGVTSENVAAKYNVTRHDQDTMAAESNARALNAQKTGRFTSEIVPVSTFLKDKDGKKTAVVISADDGPRASTMESLAKLKTVFKKVDGTTTAGNASQVSDGAAAVMLMRRSTAVKLGAPIIGTFRTFQVIGCAPEVMGIGPALAIPQALKQAGLTTKDIDIYEVNEAFASQAVYTCRELGLDMSKVNPNGGAIALGHPLGATGARQIATLMAELKRTNGKLGVVAMCIGTGMGAAAVIEAE
jgi:acetyl-CoA acyltransferase 1